MTKFLVYAYMVLNHFGVFILCIAVDLAFSILAAFLTPEGKKP